MSIEIISPSQRVEIKEKRIEFDHKDGNGGFTFPADDNYNIIFTNEGARENYKFAISSPNFSGPFKRELTFTDIEPAKARCKCGKIISLTSQYMGACECPHCGQWYNLFGQELLPPDHWDRDDYGY